jgi:hypothetical protein
MLGSGPMERRPPRIRHGSDGSYRWSATVCRQTSYDHNLYIQGYGIGANVFDKGEYLPVTAAFWWFAPDVGGVTYYNSGFLIHLLSLGINIVYMVQNDNAQPWPRRESKKQEAKDVTEIESNDESTALSGLDNLIGPCVMVPTCPSP